MSGLATELLRLYGLGVMSAVDVQRLAAGAGRDGWGLNNSVARKLMTLGGSGRYTGNVSRDLLSRNSLDAMLTRNLKPYIIQLPDGTYLDIILPHEAVFDAMTRKAKPEDWTLRERAGSDPLGGILAKWATQPDVLFGGDVSTVAAVGLHSDGVQYTSTNRAGGAKSVEVMSMNILSAKLEANRQHRIPLTILRKARMCGCGCGGFDTLQIIFEVISWSFRCCLAGVAPDRRHDGTDFTPHDVTTRLPPGTELPRAALVQMRGDWEGLVKLFRFRFYKSENFCWQCDATASAGPRCFRDCSPAAGHRATLLSHEEYLARCAEEGSQPSYIFRCPGFRLENIVVDSMHAADLGCFADALGSIMALHIGNRQWFPNQAAGLANLNQLLTAWYRAHPEHAASKITPLVLTQIHSKSLTYPFLKAKAAQVRNLAEFGLYLANMHSYGEAAPGGRQPFRFAASHRLAGREADYLRLLVLMFQGMAAYSRSLQAAVFDPTACRESMLLFLASLSDLFSLWRQGASEAAAKAAPFFFRPKAHMLQHLVQDHVPVFGNPAKFWCYRDEDFVGAIKRICANTKHPATLERRVLLKLRILAGLGVFV